MSVTPSDYSPPHALFAMTQGSPLTPFRSVLVACTPSPGMFSSEKSVLISTYEGVSVSLFADDDLVITEDGGWWLRTTATTEQCSSGDTPLTVLLPGETLETGSPWIEVAIEDTRVG